MCWLYCIFVPVNFSIGFIFFTMCTTRHMKNLLLFIFSHFCAGSRRKIFGEESSMCWTLWITGLPVCKAFSVGTKFLRAFISHIVIVIFLMLYPDLPLTGSTVTITHYYYYYFYICFFLKTTLRKMCEIEIMAIPAYTLSILAVLPFKWTQRHLPLTFHASLIQTLSISPRWPMSFCCQSTFCRDPYMSKCVCADTCEMQGFV